LQSSQKLLRNFSIFTVPNVNLDSFWTDLNCGQIGADAVKLQPIFLLKARGGGELRWPGY